MTGREGQQFGKYRLIRQLGHGGAADVYLGEHIYLKRYAAVKIVHARLEEGGGMAFRAEARILAHLRHPHIVEVLDFGVENGWPYLITRYAPGGTLRQRHPRGSQVPLELVITYVKQIAAALLYAHHHKLIHRDIKPENLLIDEQGQILLSDFGISIITASASLEQTELATSPQTAGTIPYMAPEQLRGHPVPASDQYGLAIMIYEWLTGNVPFRGTSLEIMYQHLAAEPAPLRTRCPAIPPAVEEVILRALAKEPAQRFTTVEAFATALEQAVTGPIRHPHKSHTPEMPVPISSLPGPLPRPLPPVALLNGDRDVPRRLRSSSLGRALALVGLVSLILLSSLGGLLLIQHTRTLQQQSQTQSTASAPPTSPYPAFSHLVSFDPLANPNDSPMEWEMRENCQFQGKSYQVTIDIAGDTGECMAKGTNFGNFAYQVTMTLVRGDCGGLAIRSTDARDLVMYEICQDGTFAAAVVRDNISYPRRVLRTSLALHQGLNQANVLAIVAQNTTINLYANNQQIGTLTDNVEAHGEIGLLAISQQHATVIACTNAAVWTAPP